MLRGSRTKVGNVTRDRSMPTLVSGDQWGGSCETPRKTHLSCEMSDMMMEPSFSSLLRIVSDQSAVSATIDAQNRRVIGLSILGGLVL